MHVNDPDAVAEVEALYDLPEYWESHRCVADNPLPPRVSLSRSQVPVKAGPSSSFDVAEEWFRCTP